jgi:RimJ/RimL family protein N-acetyltransferase
MQMGPATPLLRDEFVRLDPVDLENVDQLIQWTLDPIAQGPYKRVPALTESELRRLFLNSPGRQYFLIRRVADAHPLGRFYWRAWRFSGSADRIDWELNIFLADPAERGKGSGTAVQRLAAEYLATRPETMSIFAFTLAANRAEQRALVRAGFQEAGPMPCPNYPVDLPHEPCVLFIWPGLGR